MALDIDDLRSTDELDEMTALEIDDATNFIIQKGVQSLKRVTFATLREKLALYFQEL